VWQKSTFKKSTAKKGKRAKGQKGKRAKGQKGKRAKGQKGKRAKGQVYFTNTFIIITLKTVCI
jgi:hypothetical protein